jgi:hypothetical protein
MGPVTKITTKYVKDENCDPDPERGMAFYLTAVGSFDDYPGYFAHIKASYDGIPLLDEVSDPPVLPYVLNWVKISIAPPTPFTIKPGSCQNPLNVKSQGVIPLVIMNTDLLDVSIVDPTSILLEGTPPLRWSFEDVGRPIEPIEGVGGEMDCGASELPDGYVDLNLKFSTQAVLGTVGPIEGWGCSCPDSDRRNH